MIPKVFDGENNSRATAPKPAIGFTFDNVPRYKEWRPPGLSQIRYRKSGGPDHEGRSV